MRRHIAVLLAGVFMLPRIVTGQTLAPGVRVRVSHPGEGTRTGTFVALSADTLEVLLEGRSEPAHLPLGQVTRLEVSGGVRPRSLAPAGKGFLVGAGFGGVLGIVVGSSDSFFGPAGGALVFGGLLGTVGGGIGLMVGASPAEKWQPVKVESHRISLVAPSGNRGRGVGLRIAF